MKWGSDFGLKLVVENIPPGVTDQELGEVFSVGARVINVTRRADETKAVVSFACMMESIKSRVLTDTFEVTDPQLNTTATLACRLYVSESRLKQMAKCNLPSAILVKHLDPSTPASLITEHFSSFGEVVHTLVQPVGCNAGESVVIFSNKIGAINAIAIDLTHVVGDRELFVGRVPEMIGDRLPERVKPTETAAKSTEVVNLIPPPPLPRLAAPLSSSSAVIRGPNAKLCLQDASGRTVVVSGVPVDAAESDVLKWFESFPRLAAVQCTKVALQEYIVEFASEEHTMLAAAVGYAVVLATPCTVTDPFPRSKTCSVNTSMRGPNQKLRSEDNPSRRAAIHRRTDCDRREPHPDRESRHPDYEPSRVSVVARPRDRDYERPKVPPPFPVARDRPREREWERDRDRDRDRERGPHGTRSHRDLRIVSRPR